MATTEAQVVADAGPIIHLDELGCLDLLGDLGAIILPRVVWAEITAHRPDLCLDQLANAQLSDALGNPSERLISLSNSFALGDGERAAIRLVEKLSAKLFLCDDAAARLAAESLGFTVRGTLGILVRSIRVGKRTRAEVLFILQQLPQRSSLHVSRQLLGKIIAGVENE